jgi:hypothetical protein
MIKTTHEYRCDIAECGSRHQTEEVLGNGFGGIPDGWAVVRWTTKAAPVENLSVTKLKAATKRVKEKFPREVSDIFDAALELHGIGDVPGGQQVPRQFSCEALICDKCLNRIGLDDFAARDQSAPLGLV